MNERPKFMTHKRIMAGEEYVSYSDYLLLQRERDEAREIIKIVAQDKDKTIEQLIVERDSARGIYKTLHSLYADEIAKNRNLERDEAREERDLARKEINRYREKLDLLPISWDV